MQAPYQVLPGVRPRVPPGRGGIILSHLFSGTGARTGVVSLVGPTIAGVPGNIGPVRRILNRRL